MNQISTGDRLLKIGEAAVFLRASRAKMYRLVKAGDLPARKVGSTYVFYERDLLAYLDSTLVTRHNTIASSAI